MQKKKEEEDEQEETISIHAYNCFHVFVDTFIPGKQRPSDTKFANLSSKGMTNLQLSVKVCIECTYH